MIFTETRVAGAFVVEPEPFSDERGFFARLWSVDEFRARGLTGVFVQCNNSFSVRRGTLRGLHYQAAPHEEAKLCRCIKGAVFDVVADMRPASSTYLRWHGVELTAENRRMLYIPEGCAHGYLTLVEESEVIYGVSRAYQPDSERGVRWNDPALAIEWPIATDLTLSPKDQRWPDISADSVPAGGRTEHAEGRS
jgi:dTDP-4-dehydrorhamnose 3,5-epimerase